MEAVTLDSRDARVLEKLKENVTKAQETKDHTEEIVLKFEENLKEGRFRADLHQQYSLTQTVTHNATRFSDLMNDFIRGNPYSFYHQRNFILHIHRIQCTNLVASDSQLLGGKSDPYVLMAAFSSGKPYEHDLTKWKSPVLKKTLNPCWTHTGSDLSAPVGDNVKATETTIPSLTLELNSRVILEFWDKDLLSSDDFLGSVTVEMTCLHAIAYTMPEPFELVFAIGEHEHEMSTSGMSKKCHSLNYFSNPAFCTLTVSLEVIDPGLVQPPMKEEEFKKSLGLA
mmetsp:Transcript_10250/g.31579  ORF Transcript_10250/g.31579 Transcript_10250/m.31579 type:complete len:283 (-) Transcript_10250:103-951(-)